MFSACLSAQTIHKPGQYKVGRHIYAVSKIGDGRNLLIGENSSATSRVQKNPRALARLNEAEFSSQETITSSFIKVLGLKRIKELLPEKYLIVYLYLTTDGKVEAIQYNLNGNTGLTLEEIDKLTTYMKKNITFEIPSHIDSNAKLWPISQSVKFSSIVN